MYLQQLGQILHYLEFPGALKALCPGTSHSSIAAEK